MAGNSYPGRLLVAGFAGKRAVQAYALMGRSPGSRNRQFVINDEVVSTRVVNARASAGDTELTIYDAMEHVGQVHVVSNGSQTTTVASFLRLGKTFAQAMHATTYEHDVPTYTPRITAFHDLGADGVTAPRFGISVIRKDPNGDTPIRTLHLDRDLGFGPNAEGAFCVHTYNGDGDPPPSFSGRPFAVPVEDTAEAMAGMLWGVLDPENRIAVVAKTITAQGIVDFAIRSA